MFLWLKIFDFETNFLFIHVNKLFGFKIALITLSHLGYLQINIHLSVCDCDSFQINEEFGLIFKDNYKFICFSLHFSYYGNILVDIGYFVSVCTLCKSFFINFYLLPLNLVGCIVIKFYPLGPIFFNQHCIIFPLCNLMRLSFSFQRWSLFESVRVNNPQTLCIWKWLRTLS